MRKIIFGFILLTTMFCEQEKELSFSLEGKTNAIENGTILYVIDDISKLAIDSTEVTDNKFKFSTVIEKFPKRVLLKTKDFSHWRDMWIENNAMTFDATKSNFNDALIIGSKSEHLVQELNRETKELSFEERNKLEKKFVENNPNSIVSAFVLSVFSRDWGKRFTEKNFNSFPETIKASVYSERIKDFIALNKGVEIGSAYADFDLIDINGKKKLLSESIGEITLLEFWASWCGPCRKENPNLVKTYMEFKPYGFEIFAVSLDESSEKWLEAIEKDNLKWTNVNDFLGWESKPALMYGVYALPENFLIDKKGKVIARNIRGEELKNKLKELLN